MSFAGLDNDVVQQVTFVFTRHTDITESYVTISNSLIQCSSFVHRELTSALKDLEYWYEASQIQFFDGLNSGQPYTNWASDILSKTFRGIPTLTHDEHIRAHVHVARVTIFTLAKHLSALCLCAGYLKAVYLDTNKSNFDMSSVPKNVNASILQQSRENILSSLEILHFVCSEIFRYKKNVLSNSTKQSLTYEATLLEEVKDILNTFQTDDVSYV